MSLFDEPNKDAYRGTHDEGSAGPLMGFLDAFDASWEAQTRVHSLLAVQQEIRALEYAQIKKMREAGLRPPRSLDDVEDVPASPIGRDPRALAEGGVQGVGNRYLALAESIVNGGGSYVDEMVTARDKDIEAARQNRPDLGLMTYREMFAKVQETSQQLAYRDQGPKTLAGTVGGFLGGAAASMNPTTDPVNAVAGVVTAPWGGATVMGRIAMQGLAQGATEALGQGLVDNDNLLLGHKLTPGERVGRIALAGAGGAVMQGLGEGVVVGARRLTTGRWFADVPVPPKFEQYGPAEYHGPFVPEGEIQARMARGEPFMNYPDFESFAMAYGFDATPHGRTREAALRTALDLDHVAGELNRWDGPRPFFVEPPRTDTAVIREPAPGVVYDQPYQRYIDRMDTVDDIARRIDPDLFRQYEQLTAMRDQIRNTIDAMTKRFAEFRGPDTFFERSAALSEQRINDLRGELQTVDQQMRDLAPLVNRAYGQAEREWRTTPVDFNTLRFLQRLEQGTGFRYRGDGQPSLTERPPSVPAKAAPAVPGVTVGDAVPLARLTPELESRVKLDANADAPTRVAAQVAEHEKIRDEKIDKFMTSVSKIAKMDDKELTAAIKAAEQNLEKVRKAEAKAMRGREGMAAVQEAERKLDELQYVTMPDGNKLHLTQDRVPFVDDAGNAKEMTVRDFLREMDKDQQSLQAVLTCSRRG